MDWATGTWLMLGFGLGLVHAFDADHVMTLSVFASDRAFTPDAAGASPPDAAGAVPPVAGGTAGAARTPDTLGGGRRGGPNRGAVLGLRWSLGHGLVLVAVGAALLFLGTALPEAWVLWAERAVAVVMIGLGLSAFRDLARQRGHLHFHAHDDLAPHAHWHSHGGDAPPQHRHEHGPLLIGGLHGLAGSAGVLAVLPAATRSPGLGLAYLVLFAVGVSLAMATVSGLLGALAERLVRAESTRAVPGSLAEGGARASAAGGRHWPLATLRASCATGSIGLGLWMLALM